MNIRIVDSWLREFLETKAKPSEIARELSLASVSVDRIDKIGDDYVYDIEVTTNRPDLMSVLGIAREASTALSERGIPAKFKDLKLKIIPTADISFPIEIQNDPKLVNRITAVVMEVEIGKSPEKIKNRLELSGIRSLSNLIDVTNYVMREIGHPSHVFDFDLLNTKKMIIRASKPGEVITTLDGKQYRLFGGDIVADDGTGQIIDLLGVMGTANSVVRENTKRILFFLDNNDPKKIRKTSMSLGIRTEAAILNEKGVNPDLLEDAFKKGIELYQEIAKGKVISKILDVYPNKSKTHIVKISLDKLNKKIGVEMDPKKVTGILGKLGFKVESSGENLNIEIPTIRSSDVTIPEDIIEEVARIYGYHKLPSTLPSFLNNKIDPYVDNFYFEERVKNTLKYFGYTEVYTYSLISEDLYDGPIENALKLKNPLTEDMEYLRNSLVPSLLRVIEENKSKENIMIFELANVYHKKSKDLPNETLMLSGAVRKRSISFFEVKGVLEQLLEDLGIKNYKFKTRKEGPGADISIGGDMVGYIEILNSNTLDFELNFEMLLKYANIKKSYKPLAKFPAVFEDVTFVLGEGISTEDLIEEIKLQSFLITSVSLKDEYENSKTFHITYQAEDKNLTSKEVSGIREQIIKSVSEKFKAQVK